MKERWNNLALREKQTLVLGAFVLGIFFIYFGLWSPLNDKVNNMRAQIHRNQSLLVWMQNANTQIAALEKAPKPTAAAHMTGSLLSIIQREINRTPLVTALKQLHQTENDSVQMSFQQVDFDDLVAWLIQLSKEAGLTVTQMSVTPGATPGIVAADLVVKNA